VTTGFPRVFGVIERGKARRLESGRDSARVSQPRWDGEDLGSREIGREHDRGGGTSGGLEPRRAMAGLLGGSAGPNPADLRYRADLRWVHEGARDEHRVRRGPRESCLQSDGSSSRWRCGPTSWVSGIGGGPGAPSSGMERLTQRLFGPLRLESRWRTACDGAQRRYGPDLALSYLGITTRNPCPRGDVVSAVWSPMGRSWRRRAPTRS